MIISYQRSGLNNLGADNLTPAAKQLELSLFVTLGQLAVRKNPAMSVLLNTKIQPQIQPLKPSLGMG